jgi:hypothetical protein
MQHDPDIFASLERKLIDRSMPAVSPAMRSQIIDAVQTEVSKASRYRSSIPLPWLGIIVVMAAGMLQLMGSAASLENDDRPAGRSVAITPDMLKQFSHDPAERQMMADSLALSGSMRVPLLPRLDSRLASISIDNSDPLFQETP